MRITESQLKQIIKEEIAKIIKEFTPGMTLVPERPGAEGGPTQFGEYGSFEGDPATLEQIIKALDDAGMKAAADHLRDEFEIARDRPSGLPGADEWESLS